MRVRSILVACFALTLAACQGDTFKTEEAKDEQARVDHYETAALTYYDGGKYAQAERAFYAWVGEQPDNKKAKRGLARSLMMQGGVVKLREAEGIFVELVKMPWTHPERGDISYEIQSDLATTYMKLADLYQRDVQSLDDALRNDEMINAQKTKAQLQQQIQTRNELLYKAIPLWSSVLCKNKRNPYALAGLAKANLQVGNDVEGIRYAQEYLQLSRESRLWWRKQLDDWVARVGEQNVSRAQRNQLLAKVHGAREKEKLMHLLLASVYMRRAEYTGAIASYTEVIKMDPSVPAAFIERAQAYAAMRQYALAVDDIEQYLKITDPEMHRYERISAGELLQRYKGALDSGAGYAPAPRGALARPSGDAWGGGMQPAPSQPGFPDPSGSGFPDPSGGFPAPGGSGVPPDSTIPGGVPAQPGRFPAPPPPDWPDR